MSERGRPSSWEVEIMKKIILFTALFALSFVLVACGTTKKNNDQTTQDKQVVEDNTNGVTNNTDGNTGTATDKSTNTNSQEKTNVGNQDALSKMDELHYDKFTLDVEYGTEGEFEAELERDKGNLIEAEIEDSINGVRIKGTEAFDELYPLVKKLTITQQTTKDDAIKEILDVFNLKPEYSKFDVEITFKDGTKIEFEDRK